MPLIFKLASFKYLNVSNKNSHHPAALSLALQFPLTNSRLVWACRSSSQTALSYLAVINVLIGILTGSVFRVRILLGLVTIVLLECLVIALVAGAAAGLWSLTSLAAVQIGYLGGVWSRSILEKAGFAEPDRYVRDTR
jgi:hypothetical protein